MNWQEKPTSREILDFRSNSSWFSNHKIIIGGKKLLLLIIIENIVNKKYSILDYTYY